MPHQDAKPDTDSHQAGSRKGEDRAKPVTKRPTRLNADATGINPDDRKPIVKQMPILPPA